MTPPSPVITFRGPELVWTCDADGTWFQERRTRIREGNGWREIPARNAKGRDDTSTAKERHDEPAVS